jgi:phospholipase C
MVSVSVRDSLNVVGKAVSIRQLAKQRKEPFPLSLRQFVGAPPPGRILTKIVALELLQRKFDEFFNNRSRPLFKLRLHGTEFGSSTLSIFFDDPVTGYRLHGDPKDLGHLEFDLPLSPNPDFHFSDVNSDGLTLNIVPEEPAGIEVIIHFETKGEELKVNNFPNVDFDFFKIKITFHFGIRDLGKNALGINESRLDLAADEKSVVTDVSVNVRLLPDGVVASKIESNMNTKVFEALQENRADIDRLATRFLLGGDFHVTGVSSNAEALIIDYLVPPGGLEPFPEEPQLPLDPGLLANIDHIVVLMMENRSFDHMIGYLSKDGGRADVDGLRGGEKNPDKEGLAHSSFPLTNTRFAEIPDHGHDSVTNQVNGGKLDGFVRNFAERLAEVAATREVTEGVVPEQVMGHYDAAKLPVYDALAREFLICQRWFSSHPGPTFPNRFYTLTGRLNRDASGEFEFDNSKLSDFSPVATKTIFDHLTDQGVSWHYYEHGYCFLRMFERYTVDTKDILDARDPVKGFFASARAGTLPSVSFIDPDFIDVPPGNDDGPPADIADGQHLIGEVVQAVIEGPKWNKTLLVITYDEHGGFFDHVAPPEAIPVSAINEYGVRVPAFVISPWVDRGKVTDVVFDHTSILKTIARRFLSANPPDMGERMTATTTNDLSLVLRSTERKDRPSIPTPPAPVRKAALAKRIELAVEDDQDFKGLLQAMQSRYPIRR